MGVMYFPGETPNDNKSLNSKNILGNLISSVVERSRGAEINSISIDKNVRKIVDGIGVSGFVVHTDFTISNCKGKNCELLVFFYRKNFESAIKGKSSGYLSTNGFACVYQSFDVPYECSRWRDYSLFMPYGQLVDYNDDLISCVVMIRDEHNKDLARKDILNIKYR